jgi:hypothetical protein
MARIEAPRRFADGTQSNETRFHLLGRMLRAPTCHAAVRTHGGSENHAQWLLAGGDTPYLLPFFSLVAEIPS